MVTQNIVFDMAQLGRRIATYRKEMNLTQSALAETLGVSHQAISSWENGLTSPDISKLSDLSQIFEISIDDLLDNKRIASIIHKIDAVETLEEKEIVDIASMVKPLQLNTLLEESETTTFSFDSMIHILPFLEDEFLGSWMDKNSDSLSLKTLSPMLPFLNTDQIKSLLNKNQQIPLRDLVPLLPFLEEKQLSDLILSEKSKENFSLGEVLPLAPFLNEIQIKDLIENRSIAAISPLAPFISEEILDIKIKEALENKSFDDICSLARFASSKSLEMVIDTFITEKMRTVSDINGLIPFLEQKTVLRLFNYLMEEQINANSIKMFL